MKKNRELTLMLQAFGREQITVTTPMLNALAARLRAIRKERYEERVRQKKARRRPGRAEGGEGAKLADYGPTTEKLGDPVGSAHKIEQYLQSTGRTFEYLGSNGEGQRAP